MTSYLNQVMCSTPRYYVAALYRFQSHRRPRIGLLLACKPTTIYKWVEKNIHHCVCDNNNYCRPTSKPLRANLLLPPPHYASAIISRTLTKKSSARTEEKLRLKDGVSTGYELIYKAPLNIYITVAQGVSTLSLIFLFVSSIYNTTQGNAEVISMTTDIGKMVENNEQLLIMGLALLLASLGIRAVTSNYPLRIYHRNGSYIAIFTPQLPLLRKTLQFRKGDVKHTPKGFLPWRDCKYAIDGNRVLLLDDFFRKPADLTTMMETST